MKLLLCNECNDIFNLRMDVKECECGKTQGAYDADGWHAWYSGPATPLGFTNNTFNQALSRQPDMGPGYEFKAFVIEKNCPTFRNETPKHG